MRKPRDMQTALEHAVQGHDLDYMQRMWVLAESGIAKQLLSLEEQTRIAAYKGQGVSELRQLANTVERLGIAEAVRAYVAYGSQWLVDDIEAALQSAMDGEPVDWFKVIDDWKELKGILEQLAPPSD